MLVIIVDTVAKCFPRVADIFYPYLVLHLNNIPEIVWSASPNAVDIGRMSLNDLYYATI